jgi:AAA+ superfamily predicted ATPase
MIDATPADTYGPVLDRLDARIAAEIARLRVRYQLSLDEFRGLYVSDEQVDALIASDAGGATPVRDASTSRLAPRDDERWSHVVSAFALSAIEQELLVIALAPEIDSKYETLYAYLNDDVTRKWPTVSLAARLLTEPSDRAEVLTALAPQSSLRRRGLVDAIEPPSGRPSLLNTGFALAAPVSRFLQRFPLYAASDCDETSEIALGIELGDAVGRISDVLGRGDGNAPAVVLVGAPGTGRMRTARSLARALALPLRVLDLRTTRREGLAVPKEIAAAALEAALERAVVCVCGIKALADADGRLPQELHGALAGLERRGSPLVILAAPGAPWRELLGMRRALVLDVGSLAVREVQRVWSDRLTCAGFSVSDAECQMLADRFDFTPMQVAYAVATARDRQPLQPSGGATDVALVRDAASEQAREPLGQLARIHHGRFGWTDLVLPPSVLTRLQELASAIRLRHVVYGEWGFGERFSGGRGVKAMFSGASGTGKTMAAGVIASEVGLDLVKVDLSGLVSKYIGETEKNLDRVFAGAGSGSALLFFDEADALFGKRSEVKDAHDRYANIEVAYLLQKIEEHEGIVILATNQRRNIDEAFARRLHYVVDFPLPDSTLRERLWRGMFPASAPLADDVDLPFVARQFELAGGDIRIVVLDAAFLGAGDGGPMSMRHLVRALARQMAKQGRSPSPTEFQRYFELVG